MLLNSPPHRIAQPHVSGAEAEKTSTEVTSFSTSKKASSAWFCGAYKFLCAIHFQLSLAFLLLKKSLLLTHFKEESRLRSLAGEGPAGLGLKCLLVKHFER